jgi:hypothetical protein
LQHGSGDRAGQHQRNHFKGRSYDGQQVRSV